ncbi:MAG TPA: hypothetical protein VEH00_02995 [Steroidobacteraceae bacterium]|nr:hypothetical protein [Steroidobacteraceae bacterium]
MSNKGSIIDVLGERALLLPRRLEEALAANDRLKVCFTLLQAAERHADHPEEAVPDFVTERHAAGMDGELEFAIADSRREASGELVVPGAATMRGQILKDLEAMQAPLTLATLDRTPPLVARARSLTGQLPPFDHDRIPRDTVAAITRAARDGGTDSLHLLVMDLHRALNELQGSLAEEDLDGARVWQLTDADRPLVRAFMSGLNKTAPLKFDHPGLGTTATRAGGRLIIQNDIGTTDAHVLVLHVEELTATLTYTDVHAQRLIFLQSLLKPFSVEWTKPLSRSGEGLAEDEDYYLSVGSFAAKDAAALSAYLQFLGSRLVFLIDWNRARKRLREFLPKDEVVRLLKWAADRDFGHRGFLQLGGERLLYEALEFAQRTPLHYGERLYEALGTEAAFDYLQFVLREASTGLRTQRSERFIRDEIKAELARRFRTAHSSLLTLALTHAERVFDLAVAVHEGLLRHAEPQAAQLLRASAQRALKWEQEGDAIVTRIRSLARRTSTPQVYADLLHAADEAADGLEEASFLLTHLTSVAPAESMVKPLQGLAALLVAGAQESVKMFEAASHVTREGAREDLQDFFAAVDHIVAIERESDIAERAVTSTLFGGDCEVRALHLIARLSQVLEQAADGMALCAFKLRDHLLNDVMTA